MEFTNEALIVNNAFVVNNVYAMHEATLWVYRADNDAVPLWRAEVIDKRNGRSICRTAKVPSRNKAMLDGATNALDRGYLVALGDISGGKNADGEIGIAFAPSALRPLWRKLLEKFGP